MTHKYTIEGMTCLGCEATVKSNLLKVKNITDVIVSKENKEAIITMSEHVELPTLQDALGGKKSKYQISIGEKSHQEISVSHAPQQEEATIIQSHSRL